MTDEAAADSARDDALTASDNAAPISGDIDVTMDDGPGAPASNKDALDVAFDDSTSDEAPGDDEAQASSSDEAAPKSEPAPESEAAPKSEPAPESEHNEIIVKLFGRTDVGQIREHNEDNFLVADLSRNSRGLMAFERTQVIGERGTLLAVCDGMGGAAAGEVASQLAVDIIYEQMASPEPLRDHDDLATRLVSAIQAAGLRIFSEARIDRTRRGMGTTATVGALMDDHLFLGQVGDSRAYILREDNLVQVTRDQSLVNQLIEAGQLTEEEAETFEHNNIILQALGTADSVQVDLTYVELRVGDTLMMCSDGLSGMIRKEEIREILRTVEEPLEACKTLTDRANQAGGHDNITVIVAKFDGRGLRAPSAKDTSELKYRKYDIPVRPAPAPVKRLAHRDDDDPSIHVEEVSDYDEGDDEGPPRTLRPLTDDPFVIPKSSGSSWQTTVITLLVIAAVLFAAWRLLN